MERRPALYAQALLAKPKPSSRVPPARSVLTTAETKALESAMDKMAFSQTLAGAAEDPHDEW
jgi:hypothetical protein